MRDEQGGVEFEPVRLRSTSWAAMSADLSEFFQRDAANIKTIHELECQRGDCWHSVQWYPTRNGQVATAEIQRNDKIEVTWKNKKTRGADEL